ncbi:MerR family transcriptional regulator [Bacillus horti]|uniref:DNA-binding transcriptional MerR regulator n=1 Tax=Caldalkalibacillus horti TaxID=77523 RepID=A0ABT9W5B9_9BACI|nr:MerR family transcriptional regulator [Bacillus horti]MDQ0168438.1 DNA-binding transcriptional MerR regulator [Bacillus horti]
MKTYTIKELSILCKVSRRTLQYYDNEQILVADKNDKGHRLYNEEHVRLLTQINFYKGLGFPLEKIKTKIKNPDSSKELEKLFDDQSALLYRQMGSLEAKLNAIDVSKQLMARGYEVPWSILAYLMNHLNLDQIDHWGDYQFPAEDAELMEAIFKTNKEMLLFYNEFRRVILFAAAFSASKVPLESDLVKKLCDDWKTMISGIITDDPNVIAAFLRVDQDRDQWSEGERRLMEEGEPYLNEALHYYGML